MASPGKDGGGAARPQRVPRRVVVVARRRLQSGITDGPVAIAATTIRPARFPQPPANRLPQLSDVAHGDGPEQTAAAHGALALAHQHCNVARYAEHLDSGAKAQSQRARGEHHQRAANGLMIECAVDV